MVLTVQVQTSVRQASNKRKSERIRGRELKTVREPKEVTFPINRKETKTLLSVYRTTKTKFVKTLKTSKTSPSVLISTKLTVEREKKN